MSFIEELENGRHPLSVAWKVSNYGIDTIDENEIKEIDLIQLGNELKEHVDADGVDLEISGKLIKGTAIIFAKLLNILFEDIQKKIQERMDETKEKKKKKKKKRETVRDIAIDPDEVIHVPLNIPPLPPNWMYNHCTEEETFLELSLEAELRRNYNLYREPERCMTREEVREVVRTLDALLVQYNIPCGPISTNTITSVPPVQETSEVLVQPDVQFEPLPEPIIEPVEIPAPELLPEPIIQPLEIPAPELLPEPIIQPVEIPAPVDVPEDQIEIQNLPRRNRRRRNLNTVIPIPDDSNVYPIELYPMHIAIPTEDLLSLPRYHRQLMNSLEEIGMRTLDNLQQQEFPTEIVDVEEASVMVSEIVDVEEASVMKSDELDAREASILSKIRNWNSHKPITIDDLCPLPINRANIAMTFKILMNLANKGQVIIINDDKYHLKEIQLAPK